MSELIEKLKNLFPHLHFTPGKQFYWSPESKEIFYKADGDAIKDSAATWSLLHETGHALLGHSTYRADIELLRLEVAAWQKAKELAVTFGLSIDEDHVQDCLDTYRDWLYKRSICPSCSTKSLQQGDFIHYRCFNCHKVWKVSASRFCRPYRSTKNVPQPVGFHLEPEI